MCVCGCKINVEDEIKNNSGKNPKATGQYSVIYFNKVKKILVLMNFNPIIIVGGEPNVFF